VVRSRRWGTFADVPEPNFADVSERNVELARTGLEAFNRGELEGFFELLDPDVEAYVPPDLPNEGTYRGRDGFRRMMEQWGEAWEEFRAEPEEIVAKGDRVVALIRQRGRGRGSGVEVEFGVAYIFEVRDGKVVRWELSADREGALASVRG
jgi:ketosteroid isomerase-like protein